MDSIFAFIEEGMVEVDRIGERSIHENSGFLARWSLVGISSCELFGRSLRTL